MTWSYSWRYLFERLGDRYRLIAPDLPGDGHTRARPRPPAHRRSTSRRSSARCSARSGSPAARRRQLARRLPLHAPRCERPEELRAPRGDPPARVPRPRTSALFLAFGSPGRARAPRARASRSAALGASQRPLLRRNAQVARRGARVRRPALDRAGARAFTRHLGDTLDRATHGCDRKCLAERPRRRFPMAATRLAREDPRSRRCIGPKLAALVPEAKFAWLERARIRAGRQPRPPRAAARRLPRRVKPGVVGRLTACSAFQTRSRPASSTWTAC